MLSTVSTQYSRTAPSYFGERVLYGITVRNDRLRINGFSGGVLAQGSYFGELALLQKCRRTASVCAASRVEMLTLKAVDMVQVRQCMHCNACM